MRTSTVAAVAAVLALLPLLGSAQLSNQITDWTKAAQASVAALAVPNQLSATTYAYVGLSQFRAIQALRKSGYKDTVPEAAVAAFASHYVLSNLFPQRQSANFDPLLANQLAALGLSDSLIDAAETIGRGAAKKILDAQLPNDKLSKWARFKSDPAATAGKYVYTPGQTYALYPQLRWVKPLVLDYEAVRTISNQYSPLPLDSAEFSAQFNKTRDYGSRNSTFRTQYQTDTATFWADGTGTSAIGGHWISIAYLTLPANLSIYDTAKFFAQFGAATLDASITGWRVKYTKLFWRPITAIRAGYGSNVAVPDWTPFLNTPPHPEYPSGHQFTVGAALRVLQEWVGTDTVTFTIGTEAVTTPALAARTFTSLSAAATEVGDSRVYGGVHFDKASVDGTDIGVRAARIVLQRLK